MSGTEQGQEEHVARSSIGWAAACRKLGWILQEVARRPADAETRQQQSAAGQTPDAGALRQPAASCCRASSRCAVARAWLGTAWLVATGKRAAGGRASGPPPPSARGAAAARLAARGVRAARAARRAPDASGTGRGPQRAHEPHERQLSGRHAVWRPGELGPLPGGRRYRGPSEVLVARGARGARGARCYAGSPPGGARLCPAPAAPAPMLASPANFGSTDSSQLWRGPRSSSWGPPLLPPAARGASQCPLRS